jgi:hypothetical protein
MPYQLTSLSIALPAMLHTNCFPDLTADICPRDRYDPIDDQHIRKDGQDATLQTTRVQLVSTCEVPQSAVRMPLQCKLPILRLLQPWPSLPSLQDPRTPRLQTPQPVNL